MDLLIYLIDKDRIDIYDIPIISITDQYLAYMETLQQEDLEVMSEFVVMAATLLEIKARMLLPPEEKEEGEKEDPRALLVQRLLEYKKYKLIAGKLGILDGEESCRLFKEEDIPGEVRRYVPPLNLDELLDGLDLKRLQTVFTQVMRSKEERRDPVRSGFGRIQKEGISLKEQIFWVMDYARKNRRFSFCSLLESQKTRLEIVTTFLALLELMKIGKVALYQEETFGDMEIETLEEEGKEDLDLSNWEEG